MLAFVRRRASAATEALILALLVATVAGLAGLTAISGTTGSDNEAPISANQPVGQTLQGVLTIQPTAEQPDGTHWKATLNTGTQVLNVQISHEDAHRADLAGAHVQVEGTWASDGSFVAAAIDIVDATTQTASAPTGPSITLEGTLEFRHGDDLTDGRRTVTHYFLNTDTGQTEVVFRHSPSSSLAGARLRLRGVQSGRQLLVADGGTTQVASTTAPTVSTGAKRVAVVLINFSNDTSQPYTPAFAAGVAFNNSDSVAAYYAEGSSGQLTLSGDVFGWYTIPDTNDNCAYSTWSNAANVAASAAGVDLSAYDNVVYAFPTTSCGFAGVASMPGTTSWLNGPTAMSLRVMAHELGHNFGTHHASSLDCTEAGVRVSLAADPSGCTAGEYGDPFSVMGEATRNEQTNFAKGNFSWLTTGNTLTVTASGDYLLLPAETAGSSGQASLRVQRTTSAWFTMEFRQPFGTSFETFAATAPVATGVSIRLTPDYGTRSQSLLIDATPATSTFIDAPLPAGQTFVDPLTGASITTLSTSSLGALVRIELGSGSPSPSTSPAASPTSGPTATPGPTPTPSPTGTPSPTPTPGPSPTPQPGDTQAPTAPVNLTASVARSGKVTLNWTASTDNVRVTGYRVYLDGVLLATVTKTRWTDGLVLSGAMRLYDVVAFDAAGNTSAGTFLSLQ
jgi:hypothetical protein